MIDTMPVHIWQGNRNLRNLKDELSNLVQIGCILVTHLLHLIGASIAIIVVQNVSVRIEMGQDNGLSKLIPMDPKDTWDIGMILQGLEPTEVILEFLVVNVQGVNTRSLTKTYSEQEVPPFFIFWVVSKDLCSQLHMVNP